MYLPNGVQSFALSRSSFTCQKPELESSTENTFVVVLTFDAVLKSCGSMHIQSLPFGFTTVTVLFTQSVGSCILSITPKRSIRCSSSFTFAVMVTGILRGGWTTGLHEGSTGVLHW